MTLSRRFSTNNGTEVVYLEDLMAGVFNSTEVIKPFIYQWLSEGNIKTRRWQDKLYDYLISNFEGKALVRRPWRASRSRKWAALPLTPCRI